MFRKWVQRRALLTPSSSDPLPSPPIRTLTCSAAKLMNTNWAALHFKCTPHCAHWRLNSAFSVQQNWTLQKTASLLNTDHLLRCTLDFLLKVHCSIHRPSSTRLLSVLISSSFLQLLLLHLTPFLLLFFLVLLAFSCPQTGTETTLFTYPCSSTLLYPVSLLLGWSTQKSKYE